MTTKATKFYKTRDWVLGRERDGYGPEVFHETTGKWASYPALDTIHDARVIDADEAASMLPDGVGREVLEAPVDGGQSVAPLAAAGTP